MKRQSREEQFFVSTEEPEDIQVARSTGDLIYDQHGKRYIDFNAGWCVGNLGWKRKEIQSRVNPAKIPDYIAPGYHYKGWVDLAELLASIAPAGLQKSVRATGGTEAVEAAMQIAMLYTGRAKFLSVEGSYHGNSIGTLSIGSSENREQFKNLLPNCIKIRTPLDDEAAGKVEARLKNRNIAALIMEPIICNLGVMIPEHAFMKKVSALCRRYGTLLVMDEVACGFGRTGKLFACEHFGIEPDILCLAKAITAGAVPMGACMTTAKIANKVLKNGFRFYSTYGWHPLAVEAAMANIRYWKENEKKILGNVTALSQLFTDRLSQMKFRKGATLRILGLAIGIEVSDAKYAERIQQKCLKKGLLFATQEKTLTLFPPLTMKQAIAEEGLEILAGCL
ncbi:aspartate aminotransferase family protein [Flaviaesturariibacter flavus]|uniref:Aspartate aminotransferase family protein n=1 Tax=Flaviaesturariibacter flavus TaxID=2502780 RepID=A0A4R1BC72_9BACT|nr:aspartate aminotransferase family protein [Flaviaesturariibacter flavus]TCJ14594.1 aspartate aminotransferase family protein [Flaviaesturariibacter flavus]